MMPTKQKIEQNLQKMSAIVEDTVGRVNDLLDISVNDPGAFKKQLQQLGKQSVAFVKKRQLELEIRVLKLRLLDIEKRIAIELEENEEENTQPQ